MTRYEDALKELYKVHDWLASVNQAAAKSLEEGLEQTLMVNRLGLPEKLRRTFSSTNIIESCFSLADDLCRNVKHWRDANMAWRWVGTVLLDVEKRFRRVRSYREMPILVEALSRGVDNMEAVAEYEVIPDRLNSNDKWDNLRQGDQMFLAPTCWLTTVIFMYCFLICGNK